MLECLSEIYCGLDCTPFLFCFGSILASKTLLVKAGLPKKITKHKTKSLGFTVWQFDQCVFFSGM